MDRAEDQTGSVYVQLRTAGGLQGAARSRPTSTEGRGSDSAGARALPECQEDRRPASGRAGRSAIRATRRIRFRYQGRSIPTESGQVLGPACFRAVERVLASICAFAKIDLLLVGE